MTISKSEARSLLVDLVAIPSPSGFEQAAAKMLANRMQRAGFTSYIDGTGNVIGEIGDPQGPTVVLLGHIDTVSSLLPVHDSGDRLHGRGTVDAKGPLCCFVCAASAMSAAPIRIVVIGVVEEETTSRGARAVAARFRPEAVFIGEPSSADAIVIGYKGRIGGSYRRSTEVGHVAGPGLNASLSAIEFWNRISDYCSQSTSSEKILERAEASITRLSGHMHNARIDFDIRIPMAFDTEAFLLYAAGHTGDGILQIEEITHAAYFSRNSPPARAVISSLRAAGYTPKTKLKTGTCDMNVLQESWSAPMIAYGPGDSKLDHTSDEHIKFEEYFLAIQILTDGLGRLAAELAGNFGAADRPARIA